MALIVMLGSTPVAAEPAAPASRGAVSPAGQRGTSAPDARELELKRFSLDGRHLPEADRYRPESRPESRAAVAGTPATGTVREWFGLDERTGKYYRKNYTLRAVGQHIEVWVAQDLAFPAGDCRKDSVEVTEAQLAALVKEFDETIYPKETAAFSTPPDRNGSGAKTEGDFTGDGNKTVTLVDNIRDENYFSFPKTVTYVSGFFSSQLNELVDRNVMTIDAYDWKHRLGAQPADDPAGDLCLSRPARPRMYEATFAHEWQHLLGYYTDPREETWINEGLSDFAQTLVGYVDGRAGVHDRAHDSHLACFQGFGPVKTSFNANPRECGGPQNSLNLWNEGTPTEVLADYGNVYQFLLYLHDRFGLATISAIHRDGSRRGLAAVQAALPTGTALYDVLHDFQTMTLVDKIVEQPGGTMIGAPVERVTAASLRSSLNLANRTLYDTPGAAPNGADYVPLPTPLRSVRFAGAKTLPPLPVGWTIADQTFFSGNSGGLDSHAILPVTVPVQNPRLELETAYALENHYDYGYVTVSTDGGKTFTVLTGDRTTWGKLGPALTGASGTTVKAGYDLKAYAGKKVLIGLRFVSDAAGNEGGWRIGRITLGDRTLSDGSSLAGWKSPSEFVPRPVHAWHVTLVGLDTKRAMRVPLRKFALLKGFPKVVAIVAHDEPTEKVEQYAPYRLTVNGVVQQGGSTP